jgi:hypothetical protein
LNRIRRDHHAAAGFTENLGLFEVPSGLQQLNIACSPIYRHQAPLRGPRPSPPLQARDSTPETVADHHDSSLITGLVYRQIASAGNLPKTLGGPGIAPPFTVKYVIWILTVNEQFPDNSRRIPSKIPSFRAGSPR